MIDSIRDPDMYGAQSPQINGAERMLSLSSNGHGSLKPDHVDGPLLPTPAPIASGVLGSSFSSSSACDTIERRAADQANRHRINHALRRGAYTAVIETTHAKLEWVVKHAKSPWSPTWGQRLLSMGLWALGIVVALIGAASWVRWILSSVNDPLLACLLGSMLPVGAIGLHFWVSRSVGYAHDIAINTIVAILGLAGVGLVAAVAQRYGLETGGDGEDSGLGGLTATSDNRWLMVAADLTAMAGSTLIMVWAEEVGKPTAERLTTKIATARAAIARLDAKLRAAEFRATRRGIRHLLKALYKSA